MTEYISKVTPLDGKVYNIKDSEAVENVTYSEDTLTINFRNGTSQSYEIKSSADVQYLSNEDFLEALFN